MPWTVDDVERFNKGLSDKEKKHWVRVANAVLKTCMESGKSEKECAGKAVRQANSVVANHMSNNVKVPLVLNAKYEIQRDSYKGINHLIVPVVMMVEGVHNGSDGRVLQLEEEFGKYPDSWNGIPVVVFHPEEDGAYISANSPNILDRQEIGRVFNVHVEDGKLRGDAWINEGQAIKVDPRILDHLNCHSELEVSIGSFTDNDYTSGVWKDGEEYVAIARNHRPDHLALLPGGVGACSWADGCGIRANENKGGEKESEKKEVVIVNKEANMEDKKKDDCPGCPKKVELLVQSEHTPYEEKDREFLSTLNEAQLDQLISMNIEISDRKKEIQTLQEANKKKEAKKEPMELSKEQMLQALTEKGGLTFEQFKGLLPPEVKEQIETGMKMQADRKTELVERITTNSKSFTEKELLAKSLMEIEKIASLIPEPADFTGQGDGFVINAQSADDVLLPVGVELKQ